MIGYISKTSAYDRMRTMFVDHIDITCFLQMRNNKPKYKSAIHFNP